MRFIESLVRSDFAQNLARDFKSLRTLWNWIYMALYVWISVYAVRTYPDAISTVVTVTGGVVSVIFTGYVFTKTYEKTRSPRANDADLPGQSEEA